MMGVGVFLDGDSLPRLLQFFSGSRGHEILTYFAVRRSEAVRRKSRWRLVTSSPTGIWFLDGVSLRRLLRDLGLDGVSLRRLLRNLGNKKPRSETRAGLMKTNLIK